MSNFKYYLTFDVGIVNLAYCLARQDISNNTINCLDLLDWGILDVSFKPLICKCIKNKRAICNKKSIFYSLKLNVPDIPSSHKKHDNLIGYCQDHATELREMNKKDYSCLFRISKNPLFLNNFNAQMERLLTALEIFFNKKILSIYHTENEQLFSISNLEIVIENQPVFKNPIMKTISIAIFTFFTLKKVINPTIIKYINFISPKEKTQPIFIKSLTEKFNIIPKSNVNFKVYNERKDFAIDATNQIILKLSNSVFNIVSSINYSFSTKKDDMADTLLYVIILMLK